MIKNILYFTSYDISDTSGPAINEYEFAKSLSSSFRDSAWLFIVDTKESVPGIGESKQIYFKDLSGFSLIKKILYSIEVSIRINSVVKKNNIDLVVARLDSMPFIPLLLIYVFRIKVVVKSCGLFWENTKNSKRLTARLGMLIRKWTTVTIIKKSLAIDVVTVKVAEYIAKYIDDKSKIIHLNNAVDVNLFKPEEVSDNNYSFLKDYFPVLGYIGGNPSYKGADQLVKIATRLSKKYSGIAIVIAGEDKKLNEIKVQAKNQGLANNCFFLGKIPYSNVNKLINCLDIGFALNTKENVSIKGNSSQKIRQYISCGVPVICVEQSTNFIEDKELGSVVDPDNIDQIQAKVEYWIASIKSNKSFIKSRLREYAVREMSTDLLMKVRIKHWEYHLDKQNRIKCL